MQKFRTRLWRFSLLFSLMVSCGACAASAQATGAGEQSPGATQPVQHRARISGGVMAGQILTKVNPVYPADARAQGVSGTVVMHATIGTDGAVTSLEVISGPEALRDAALDAVRQWTYKPYLLNGEPVEVETTITVNFNLAPQP